MQRDPQAEMDTGRHATSGDAINFGELRFRTLFNHAPVGVVLADSDSRYVDANPRACQLLGYSHEELTSLGAADIIAKVDVGEILPALNAIHRQAVHQREWQFRRRDGITFSANVIAMQLPDGTLLGIIDDITDRQLIEEYREHFAAIVGSSSDAIIGTDLQGAVTSWNAAAEDIFGYAASEMIGAPISRLIPEARQEEDSAVLEMLRNGEKVRNWETIRRTRDGRLIDVSVSISPIRDGEGGIIGGARIARDISALKEHEAEIIRMSRLYAALSQINQAIVWSPDREALFSKVCEVLVQFGEFTMAWIGWPDSSGRVVPVAQFGDTTDYLQGISVYTDDRPEGQGPIGLTLRSGRSYICNDTLNDSATLPWRSQVNRAGFRASAAFPIRLGGELSGILSIYADKVGFFHDKEIALLEEAATDLSFALDNFARDAARRQAEDSLRDEKNFSDTMIESMPGIVYFYDFSGRFLRWNRNFEAASGYSAAEIAGMHPRDFFSSADQRLVEQTIARVFDRGEASLEADFVSKDGTLRPYFFTGSRVLFKGVNCLIGVGVDITERKQVEAERERRVRAEAADHIKSAFLANMSHELRTPLNSIIGFTGIMLQGLAGPFNEEQEKQLAMVRNSARHLLALVNDVLDVSKIEAGQLDVVREPFDIGQSISKVVALVMPQADAKRLALRVHLEPGLGQAVSDARRFEQILLNLLSNAIKFTEAGQVSVTASLVAQHRHSDAAGAETAICLQVADTGIGIAADDLQTLFQPFRQIETGLSRSHEGTGLGLAICRRLAELMGGKIQVQSELGRGSVFTVLLPVGRAA
jgi:PAS domain S-box-containing protein